MDPRTIILENKGEDTMIKDYHFKDIEKYLKKDTDIGNDILDAFDSLSDAAIIFSPILFGPQFLPMLDLLDVKDRLVNLGHKVYNFIAQKVEIDYIDRTEQMRAAYALICYTAYFDVLQDVLPSDVRRKLKLKFEKKKELMVESIDSTDTLQTLPVTSDIHCNIFYADHVTSFADVKKQLTTVYERVTRNLIKMVLEASIFNEEKNKEKKELESLKTELEKIPQRAIKVYESQYISLADQFNDFALFAQLKNFEGIHYAIKKNKAAIDSIAGVAKKIDVGLKNLNSIVNSIAVEYSDIQAQDIVDDLTQKYTATIEEPIIDDKEISSDTETISLRFPRIVDAFIPQSYKCLCYERKETKLEDISVWSQLPIQHDLDRFFVKYLYSPDSIDYPLVILGQPGSGKSLLTKVLSAQLMSKSYVVIRIPLREVNAEDGIDVLVEDQIKKLTNRPLSAQGYGGFATQFNEKPLIIILDGYDELLQAKGDVFSGYLEMVRRFQQDQKAMKRPVRIIITSRITLIDKARIPINSTILRLMEFNPQQRKTWIDIWNNINTDYFAESNITPFSLPEKEKGKENSIIELAEQPLLLLMLALYDSEANELAKTNNIKRTELYDNLLRRFVRRERRRYVPGFEDKSVDEQEKIIDQEMGRLGVVAIGMYNREEVVILSRQLEEDLDTFNARRDDGSPKLHTLKESESVLGGFFFIHKSTAQDIDAHSDNSQSAYEFLHNTFGEFLTADFILRNTINEVKDIFVDRKYKTSGLTNKLSNPDSLNPGWFYCLMFVPLYSRPVVIEMLREHAIKALERALQVEDSSININQEDFVENLKFLVQNQLKMVLNTRNSPKVMRSRTVFDQDMPLLGYLSTYTLNLVILACTLSQDGFEFNEEEYCYPETNVIDARPWDKLTSLWKAWFPSADLMGLSVILKAKRKNNTSILIRCNKKFEATRYEQPIDILLCVSFTLGDNLLAGLSGLQTQRFCEITRMSNENICEMLKEESSDLYFSYLITLLRKEINGCSDEGREPRELIVNYKKVNSIIKIIIHDTRLEGVNRDTILSVFEIFEYCLMRNIIFVSTKKDIIKVLPHLIDSSKLAMKKMNRYPEIISGVHLLQLLVKNEGFLVIDRFDEPYSRHEFFGGEWSDEIDRLMHFSSRYIRDDIWFFQDFDRKDTYRLTFYDTFKKLSVLKEIDRKKVLLEFFSFDNIEILLETNPELLANALLSLLINKEIRLKELPHIIDVFLKGYLNQLESVGIGFVEFKSIINAIKIARYVKSEWFLNHIIDVLRYQLFGRHPRYFLVLVYLYPGFIADLIDVMPEIFISAFPDLFEVFFIERDFRYVDAEKAIDYIKLLRHFYELARRENRYSEKMPKGLHMLERMIQDSDGFREVNFEDITLSQIDDLAWYANFTKNESFSRKIYKFLDQYFELHHNSGYRLFK